SCHSARPLQMPRRTHDTPTPNSVCSFGTIASRQVAFPVDITTVHEELLGSLRSRKQAISSLLQHLQLPLGFLLAPCFRNACHAATVPSHEMNFQRFVAMSSIQQQLSQLPRVPSTSAFREAG